MGTYERIVNVGKTASQADLLGSKGIEWLFFVDCSITEEKNEREIGKRKIGERQTEEEM
jgi:hypothetical protein